MQVQVIIINFGYWQYSSKIGMDILNCIFKTFYANGHIRGGFNPYLFYSTNFFLTHNRQLMFINKNPD